MKTQTPKSLPTRLQAGRPHVQSWAPAAVFLLLLGCATQPQVRLGSPDGQLREPPIVLGPGPIAVVSPRTLAAVGFDKAQGQMEEAGERAADVAYRILETPTATQPHLEVVGGAVRFAVAPFVAIPAAIRASHEKLFTNKLAECEADLLQAMSAMADQQHLRNGIIRVGAEKTSRQFIPVDAATGAPPGRVAPSAVLETTVEELRLERTGTRDSSYALRVKARVRLLRATDGAVLCDQPFEHRSGTALFVDWTLSNSMRNVASTAYRKLAEQMVERLFTTTSQETVLLGAGNPQAPANLPDSPIRLAAQRSPAAPRPLVRFAAQQASASDTIEIYSLRAPAVPNQVAVQTPLTKEEAISEAIKDVEWSLEGLLTSQDCLVQGIGFAAAIPMSLYKQTVGAIRGLTNKKSKTAQASLSAAVAQIKPRQELASQVAQQLTPVTSQPVMLVNGPFAPRGENRPEPAPGGGRTLFVNHRPDQKTVIYPPNGQAGDSALVIELRQAALRGGEGVNSPLALCLEAQVTLRRASDGEVLYTCPLHYRSAKRKFTTWAAQDAALFRQEFKDATRQMSGAIVERLVSLRLIAPDRAPSPTLASTSQ